MSDETHNQPEPGLGLRSIRKKSRAARFLATKRAMRPRDAELLQDPALIFIEEFVSEIAVELQLTHTPLEIAKMLARHMIGADALLLKQRKATEQADTAVADYRAKNASKRAQSVAQRKAPLKNRAEVIAKEKWEQDTENKIRIGAMAEMVYEDLVKEFPRNLLSGKNAVRTWIRSVAPAYASAPGRSAI